MKNQKNDVAEYCKEKKKILQIVTCSIRLNKGKKISMGEKVTKNSKKLLYTPHVWFFAKYGWHYVKHCERKKG